MKQLRLPGRRGHRQVVVCQLPTRGQPTTDAEAADAKASLWKLKLTHYPAFAFRDKVDQSNSILGGWCGQYCCRIAFSTAAVCFRISSSVMSRGSSKLYRTPQVVVGHETRIGSVLIDGPAANLAISFS